jgi:hypothetical protein
MMPIIRFSRVQLTKKLDKLSLPLRVIFAATCAERLLPAYTTFSDLAKQGEPETLERILARLWKDVAGDVMSEGEIHYNIRICTDLIPPDDDEYLGVETAYAEDADVALIYALSCRKTGDSQEAMWSAQRAADALDHFVFSRDNVNLNAPGALDRTLADPLIQAELARQLRDIDELLGAAGEDVKQVAARFRDRAKVEGRIFFGVPS